MSDQHQPDERRVNGEQRAIVDQSVADRDPADDSGEIDDPTALVETYPKAFDDKIAEAENAIKAEAASDTDLTDSETTGVSRVTERS